MCQEIIFISLFISLMINLTVGDSILASAPNLHVQLNDVLFMEIIRPSSISYTYKIRLAKNFGTDFMMKYNNIDLVMAEPFHGCSRFTNADFLLDKIAFVQRGKESIVKNEYCTGDMIYVPGDSLFSECSFVTKAIQAEEAGAVAVVISDNDVTNAQNFVDMIDDSTERAVNIPAVFLLGKDGYMIKNTLENTGMHSAIVNIPINVTGASIYQISQPPWTLW